ncbi:hypothetical protein [Nonomuraea recticatena]|uniref:hypothetical protein n=1 Tax=Nonomuraea recticatena TaxID=46178 RepID=UPI00361D9967
MHDQIGASSQKLTATARWAFSSAWEDSVRAPVKRQTTIRLASASTRADRPQPISATECAENPAARPSVLSSPSHTRVIRDSARAVAASLSQVADAAGCA